MTDKLHYYYLHTNGSLIHKRSYPTDSDFVRQIWVIDITDRGDAWRLILESLALGANQKRVKELIDLWKCDLMDLIHCLTHNQNPSQLERDGLKIYFEVIGADYDKWMDWLAATPIRQTPDFESMPGISEVRP